MKRTQQGSEHSVSLSNHTSVGSMVETSASSIVFLYVQRNCKAPTAREQGDIQQYKHSL